MIEWRRVSNYHQVSDCGRYTVCAARVRAPGHDVISWWRFTAWYQAEPGLKQRVHARGKGWFEITVRFERWEMLGTFPDAIYARALAQQHQRDLELAA